MDISRDELLLIAEDRAKKVKKKQPDDSLEEFGSTSPPNTIPLIKQMSVVIDAYHEYVDKLIQGDKAPYIFKYVFAFNKKLETKDNRFLINMQCPHVCDNTYKELSDVMHDSFSNVFDEHYIYYKLKYGNRKDAENMCNDKLRQMKKDVEKLTVSELEKRFDVKIRNNTIYL